MQTVTERDLTNIKLTIENTEPLYKVAISINDFDWQSEQINNLYAAAAQQIKDEGGQIPILNTDFDVRAVNELVAEVARELQSEL